MAFCWHADDGPTLNACLMAALIVIFQEIRTSIAKKPYIFVILQGVGGGGLESLSPIWICACIGTVCSGSLLLEI